jgi:gamma-glutamylcyclotransferase (GGCT)/AIG2-like uncharacterized protein YtfP
MRARLFVYGTLMRAKVVRGLIGRVPAAREATLRGFARCRLRGRTYPGLVGDEGGSVSGMVYEVTREELDVLDQYEGPDYERVLVEDGEGGRLYVYLTHSDWAHLVMREAPEV